MFCPRSELGALSNLDAIAIILPSCAFNLGSICMDWQETSNFAHEVQEWKYFTH